MGRSLHAAALFATLVACRSHGTVADSSPRASPPPQAFSAPPPPPPVPVVVDAHEAGADAGELAPLVGPPFETWRAADLEVVVSVPVGAREPRPIVVGLHGSRDRPEAACARWRRTFGAWPFIACPRGVPWRGGLAWGSPEGVAERIDHALATLREHHGARVSAGPVVYAGWSLGATLGPRVVALRPGLFDVVVLAEIGHTRINVTASASGLHAGRATRTIVACATQRCASFARRLDRANAGTRSKSGGGAGVAMVDAGIGRGHVFDDRMARAIGAAVREGVALDARWSGLGAALDAIPADADAAVFDEPLPPVDDEPDLAEP